MSNLHTEAREIFKRLRKRHKENGDPLDLCVLNLLTTAMKMIPEYKDGELHPTHRLLILCCNKTNKLRSEKRDPKEVAKFQKIQSLITHEEAEALLRFYRLPKSKECDETWSRKTAGVITLMNDIANQRDLAAAYFEDHPNAGKPAVEKPTIPEPDDWRGRAAGATGEYSWTFLCKTYPEEARRLAAGENLNKPIDTSIFGNLMEKDSDEQ